MAGSSMAALHRIESRFQKRCADLNKRIKKCRPCKPGSVSGREWSGSLSFIYDDSRLPPPATYPPTSGEPPSIVGVHGLATYGTYGRSASLPPRWALTPPFHPYRPTMRPAVVLCYAPIPSRISSRLACVALCVARTFLSRFASAATERACGAKVSIFRRFSSFYFSFLIN